MDVITLEYEPLPNLSDRARAYQHLKEHIHLIIIIVINDKQDEKTNNHLQARSGRKIRFRLPQPPPVFAWGIYSQLIDINSLIY